MYRCLDMNYCYRDSGIRSNNHKQLHATTTMLERMRVHDVNLHEFLTVRHCGFVPKGQPEFTEYVSLSPRNGVNRVCFTQIFYLVI